MRVGEGDVQTVTDLFSKGILSTKEERKELCNFLRAAKKEFSDYAVKYGKKIPGGVDFLWRAFNNPIAPSWSSGSPSASLFHHVEEFDNTAESPFQARGAGQAEAVGGPADPSSSQQSYQPNLLSGLDAAVVTGGLSTLVMTSAMLILGAQVDAENQDCG